MPNVDIYFSFALLFMLLAVSFDLQVLDESMGLEVRWAIAGALRELVTYRSSLIFFKIFEFFLSDINSFSDWFLSVLRVQERVL
jgi:hypothetical protein